MNKKIVSVVVVLVIVITFLFYYIMTLQKPAEPDVKIESKITAEKASSDLGSKLGDIQKELKNIQSGLPG